MRAGLQQHVMKKISDIRLNIIKILSDDQGHTHTDISRLLGPKDKDRSGKKKGYDGYDKGDLTKILQAMMTKKLIFEVNDNYYLMKNEETFSYIIDQSIKIGSDEFYRSFLESEYVDSLIRTIGFKSILSEIRCYFDKNRSFRDIAFSALLSRSATIEEYKSLPELITNYFNSMENIEAMSEVGKKFQKDSVDVERSSPAYKWMQEAFHSRIQQHDGALYSTIVGNIEELEILHDLGIQGVIFYRKHLLEDFVSLFERRTNAKNRRYIIEYVQLDNYLSPFTAYPVNHPIELMFSRNFGRLYEDAYLIDPIDLGILLSKANLIFEHFHEFARIYIGSRSNKEAAIKELILNWNIACARFETIFYLLADLAMMQKNLVSI